MRSVCPKTIRRLLTVPEKRSGADKNVEKIASSGNHVIGLLPGVVVSRQLCRWSCVESWLDAWSASPEGSGSMRGS